MTTSQRNETAVLPAIGAPATSTRTITQANVELFAGLSGDQNPVNMDSVYAAQTPFGKRIAHGMLTANLISSVLGNILPGPGSMYLTKSLRFQSPVHIGDTITASVEVTAVREDKRIVTLHTECTNQDGTVVLSGEAVLKC